MTAIKKAPTISYGRLPLSALRELACQMHPDHDEEASREYVARLLDLEVERRLSLMHERPGWHPSSPGFGDGTGKSTEPIDAMYLALIRGIRIGEWHNVAKRALSQIRERNRLAVLLQTAKADSRLEGPWCATHDQVAASLGHYARLLGWASVEPLRPTLCRDKNGEIVRMEVKDEKTGATRTTSRPRWQREVFKNGQAIKFAAHKAKEEMILLAKAGAL